MGRLYLTVVILALAMIHVTKGQSGENISKVHDDVITLNPMMRPVRNYTDQIVMHISFHLMSINNLDMVQQKLTTNGWLEVKWKNQYATWDPAQYGGVLQISPKANSVWLPKLNVINTLKEFKPLGEDDLYTLLHHNGESVWYPTERFETSCNVDVTYFPFDTQRCGWHLMASGEGSRFDLTDLQADRPHVDLDIYTTNGEWELVSSRARGEIVSLSDGIQYRQLDYEITIRRRPRLLALMILLPVIVLAVLNVFVFTIPAESGERLSYAMTSLLSFGVFMSIITSFMPSSTETLSIVAVNMSCLLVLSAVYVLCCILSLRLFHRDDLKHPVPKSLQTVIVWLEALVCLDPTTRNKVCDTQDKPGKDSHEAKQNKGPPRLDSTEMTWKRVSRTMDRLFFRFFLALILMSGIVICTMMRLEYSGNE